MATKIDIVIQAVDNLSSTVKKVERNVAQMSKKIQQSTKTVERSTKQMSAQTVSSLAKMNTAFGTLSTNMRRIGALVGSFYAIRSAAVALGAVADDFKDFNEAMAYVNTIAQMTEKQLVQLTQQVENLSVQIGKSAPEIARGLYDIYSSGFEGAEAMKVLEVATEGAIAGMTTTAVAAKGLMAVMNAYNRKTGPDAIEIMDNMFKTVDKGVITFEELASEIGSVVTMSSQLGIPFTEVSAAMSEMTLRGISAAEAATALEGLMRSLMKPSDQAKEAIKKLNAQNKELNFQWNVSTLRAKGLGGVMEDLSRAAQGNYEVIGAIIPNIRGMRAAMVLASGDVEGFIEMLDEQANSAGATERALNEANKSINRQLEKSRAEWDKYKREVGEALANVQLNAQKSLVEFAKWVDKNRDIIVSLAEAVTMATGAFIAFKVAVLSVAGTVKIFTWIAGVRTAILALSGAFSTATATAIVLRSTIAGIGMGTVLGAGLLGGTAIYYTGKRLDKDMKNLQESVKGYYDIISGASVSYRERAESDIKILQVVKENAQKQGNMKAYQEAEKLEKDVMSLKNLYVKNVSEQIGAAEKKALHKRINEQRKIVEDGLKSLEKSRLLVGGLSILPPTEAGVTEPEYGAGASLEELFGPEIDKEAEKILKTIKRVKKEMSEFYVDLGDLANEHTEALEDETDAFAESVLKWGRYLEDMNVDLTRMAEKHTRVIKNIKDDISIENRDFNESMDDRARKFQQTMNKINQSHQDKVEDLEHDLALEIGMGLRADKERIKELEKRLARENRDYALSVQEKREERELEDSRERRDNNERLVDLRSRLALERKEYQQRTDDIKKELDREKADYAQQQDEIRAKSNSTLQGIVEDYQKAFKDIFDAIRESGVPSLLAQLPELAKEAMDASIGGVDIPRNIRAEQEFVKNWGGLYGRLPSKEEISMGVYGTQTGPNNPINININNPVVTSQEYINIMTNQIDAVLAERMRLARSGAY